MKRILVLLLCACMISTALMLSGCNKGEEEESEFSDSGVRESYSLILYKKAVPYYEGLTLTDYTEAIALAHCGFDMSKCVWAPLFRELNTDAESYAGYLLAYKALENAGVDMSAYSTEKALAGALACIDIPSDLSTTELSQTILALNAYGAEYDKATALDILAGRQVQSRGLVEKKFDAETDTAASAWGLLAYLSLQKEVGNATYDNMLHDGILEYLGDSINNDNTVSDSAGKPSVIATAIALTAFISAGVPRDGEISTCLLAAIDRFGSDKTFTGYPEYSSGKAETVPTAFAMLAFSTSMYGNPFDFKAE